MKHRLRRAVRDLLFPPRCSACGRILNWYGAVTAGRTSLCESCRKSWESACKSTCRFCDRQVSHCMCLTEQLRKARAAAFCKAVYYDPADQTAVQNRILYRIKNQGDVRTSEWLAGELWSLFDSTWRELEQKREQVILTYVPRSRRNRLSAGTDQAAALARALSHVSNLPLYKLIRHRRMRGEQKMLTAEARLRNAKQSYHLSSAATERVQGKTVILVDDIVTTGASMAACVRLLRRAGAACVYCLAVATDDVNSAGSL